MNSQHREELARARAFIEQAQTIIQTVRSEEQQAFDNLSEGLQQTTRGQAYEEIEQQLAEADDSCDNVIANLDAAVE
jgi:hypothetical protein